MICSLFVIAFPLSMITMQYAHVVRVFAERQRTQAEQAQKIQNRVEEVFNNTVQSLDGAGPGSRTGGGEGGVVGASRAGVAEEVASLKDVSVVQNKNGDDGIAGGLQKRQGYKDKGNGDESLVVVESLVDSTGLAKKDEKDVVHKEWQDINGDGVDHGNGIDASSIKTIRDSSTAPLWLKLRDGMKAINIADSWKRDATADGSSALKRFSTAPTRSSSNLTSFSGLLWKRGSTTTNNSGAEIADNNMKANNEEPMGHAGLNVKFVERHDADSENTTPKTRPKHAPIAYPDSNTPSASSRSLPPPSLPIAIPVSNSSLLDQVHTSPTSTKTPFELGFSESVVVGTSYDVPKNSSTEEVLNAVASTSMGAGERADGGNESTQSRQSSISMHSNPMERSTRRASFGSTPITPLNKARQNLSRSFVGSGHGNAQDGVAGRKLSANSRARSSPNVFIGSGTAGVSGTGMQDPGSFASEPHLGFGPAASAETTSSSSELPPHELGDDMHGATSVSSSSEMPPGSGDFNPYGLSLMRSHTIADPVHFSDELLDTGGRPTGSRFAMMGDPGYGASPRVDGRRNYPLHSHSMYQEQQQQPSRHHHGSHPLHYHHRNSLRSTESPDTPGSFLYSSQPPRSSTSGGSRDVRRSSAKDANGMVGGPSTDKSYSVREVEKQVDVKLGDTPGVVHIRVVDWNVAYKEDIRQDVLKLRLRIRDEDQYRRLMRMLAEFV
jgi:hypothetical protein